MTLYLTAITFIHVAISLVGIASGFVALFGLLGNRPLNGWTTLFLVSTAATSLTGFAFPVERLLPSHIVGIISLVVLAVAFSARYRFHLAGGWRWAYVISSTTAFYLNVFVGIVQAFQKIPVLKAVAPTQSELPFAFTQLVVLAIFFVAAILAGFRFRLDLTQPQSSAI